MKQNKDWFTEDSGRGCAFSLAVKQHCHHEKTPFQTIDIYETESFGYLMTIDGYTMVSTKENFFYHEMMAHVPLCTHPNPKQVVIIGGGDCGTLQQCLRHPLTSIRQIEIDQRVTELSTEYFPELCRNNDDARAQLMFIDGIAWMQAAEPNSVDVIIVDSTDPVGPGEGLFNLNFYQQCARVLKSDGILCQQSESPLVHQTLIREMRHCMQQAGLSHQRTFSFPQPIYPTGFWSATMASASTLQCPRMLQELENECHYYNHGLHQSLMNESGLMRMIAVN